MDEFDDFDLQPQSDEFIPDYIDNDDDIDFDDDDADTIVDDDEVVSDDDDLRPYSREWDEDDDMDDMDWDCE